MSGCGLLACQWPKGMSHRHQLVSSDKLAREFLRLHLHLPTRTSVKALKYQMYTVATAHRIFQRAHIESTLQGDIGVLVVAFGKVKATVTDTDPTQYLYQDGA